VLWGDDRDECRERVRCAAAFESPLQHAVDPGRKSRDAPVPLERDRVSQTENLSVLVVDQDELEFGQLLVEPVPVGVGDVTMLQELRPDAIEAEFSVQVGSVGEGYDHRSHGPIVPGGWPVRRSD
jgi:hypothetical protein